MSEHSDPLKQMQAGCSPRHVAIIMDGNGRWAKARGMPRFLGHRSGVEALRRAVRVAGDRGISYLTVFAFSSENWKRPAEEVEELLGLLKRFLRRDLAELHANNVRVVSIGERASLSDDLLALIENAETLTAGNTALTLVIAFNYGSRNEIARAMRSIAEDVAAGKIKPDTVDEALVAEHLDTAGIPDPDLIIRTSGELRLSNFLLWQSAYAEFVFLPCLWPDFGEADFDAALCAYAGRERRFGDTKSGAGAAS